VSSAAIARPELLSEIADRYGNQVLVLSLDLKLRTGKTDEWVVTSHGGREVTDIDAIEWISRCAELGVGELLVNSIDADGTKNGFDLPLIRAVRAVSNLPLIASGGAGSSSDFVPAAGGGADAVLAASIFHNRTVTIAEAKQALSEGGFTVR
jgi:cyclase